MLPRVFEAPSPCAANRSNQRVGTGPRRRTMSLPPVPCECSLSFLSFPRSAWEQRGQVQPLQRVGLTGYPEACTDPLNLTETSPMADPSQRWIADRMRHIEASGIRKVVELARSLKNPCNLSIGQPHFDVPQPIKDAAHAAIDQGANSYTVTQGIPELRVRIHDAVQARYPNPDREVFITSGTSGGLLLALCCTVNPGDEVLVFDPYFVMYPHLVALAGGVPVFVDTYPDFDI